MPMDQSLLTHRLLPLFHLILLLLILPLQNSFGQQQKRSFDIDWSGNTFLKDGQPFTYISGSIHYFRVPVEYWSDRLIKMKYAGLNAIQTYVEWRSHEPANGGPYDFTGNLDLFRFIETAHQHGLLVILRPGPYICAERDMGGLPSWLLNVDPSMKLRTNDSNYIKYVTRWFNYLLPRLNPYLYNNGGPVIMMQVENEYGSYMACDYDYTYYLRDLMVNLTNDNVVLFTTDGNGLNYLKCGQINGTLATIDFGPGADVTQSYSYLRSVQPNGPLVNSEYYTGWLDHWSEPHSITADDLVVTTLDTLLSQNISVNLYMFIGGTNFDLGAGANWGDHLQAQPTSYDYDSPLTESGDLTSKYWAIRSTIAKYYPVPEMLRLKEEPKMSFAIIVERTETWDYLMKIGQHRMTKDPLTFESLGVSTGFVVYSTTIDLIPSDPTLLTIKILRDRAIVLVDGKVQGILSRAVSINSLPIEARLGSRLDLIIENEGRISYGPYINEEKGIIGEVKLGSITMTNWTHTYFERLNHFLDSVTNQLMNNNHNKSNAINVTQQIVSPPFPLHPSPPSPPPSPPPPPPSSTPFPSIFECSFQLPVGLKPSDTFVNLSNFTKGVARLNGHSLGKYWPHTGPQVTLYAPGVWFKPYPDQNVFQIFETLGTFSIDDRRVTIQFQTEPILNGSIPFSKVRTFDYWSSKLPK